MIPIPRIENGLFLAPRDRPCLVEGRLGVVSLPRHMTVEGLQVDCPPQGAIFLRADDHPMAPGDRGANAMGTFSSTPSATSLSRPGLATGVALGLGCGGLFWIDEQAEWWSRHHWQWLVLAGVERA